MLRLKLLPIWLFFLILNLWATVAQAVDYNQTCKSQGFDGLAGLACVSNLAAGMNGDRCGFGPAAVACPTCSIVSEVVDHNVCCQKIDPNTSQTVYGCVNKSGVFATAAPDATDVAQQEIPGLPTETDPIIFKPSVTIPGSITMGGKEIKFTKGEGIVVTSDTINKYLAVFYQFFVAALAVIAVVMVMWGGFKRIMAAGSAERIKDANDTIFSALSGLVLALVSYSLLQLINPQLVNLKPLEIEDISRVEFKLAEADNDIAAQANPALSTIMGDNIINSSGAQADMFIVLGLRAVAAELKSKGMSLVVASAYRSEAKQRELIVANCQNPPGSATCNPKPGKPTTCILANGPTSCPHTTGRAVDVWVAVGGTQVITQQQCMADKPACESNNGMSALIAAMRADGFCKLCSEPWHFERPKMSACCN
jgi:D-alanyl-D-alanine dipeptidase